MSIFDSSPKKIAQKTSNLVRKLSGISNYYLGKVANKKLLNQSIIVNLENDSNKFFKTRRFSVRPKSKIYSSIKTQAFELTEKNLKARIQNFNKIGIYESNLSEVQNFFKVKRNGQFKINKDKNIDQTQIEELGVCDTLKLVILDEILVKHFKFTLTDNTLRLLVSSSLKRGFYRNKRVLCENSTSFKFLRLISKLEKRKKYNHKNSS